MNQNRAPRTAPQNGRSSAEASRKSLQMLTPVPGSVCLPESSPQGDALAPVGFLLLYLDPKWPGGVDAAGASPVVAGGAPRGWSWLVPCPASLTTL